MHSYRVTITNTAFHIRLASSGETLLIPQHKSIVQVLREHDYYIDTCCEQGYCGTCMTPYLAGQPEHHDNVLSAQDREQYVMICCARAKSAVLVLDL